MYLIPSICGSTRKPAVHNFYEFSVKGLFCPVVSSFRWHEHLTTGCRTTLLPAGMARFCTRTPPSFPSPGGAYGSGVHGPTRRCNFKKGRTYLKLNIVISVACLWISLKLHRCISTSLGCRSKNKVIFTILWWFCRWSAPVILRVKKQSLLFTSLTQTVTFCGIKS